MCDKLLIVGEGSSGKSTYANNYKNMGYYILHLDDFIRNKVSPEFNSIPVWQIYNKEIHDVLKKNKVYIYFINTIKNIIKKHTKIVIEGSLKNKEIIHNIFKNYDYKILIIKPKNKAIYVKRVIKRFIKDPANYGRLGFLAVEDRTYMSGSGLNDYIKNRTKGKIFNKMINNAVNRVYKKHKENELYFKDNFAKEQIAVIRI